jgi:hypothetical protein
VLRQFLPYEIIVIGLFDDRQRSFSIAQLSGSAACERVTHYEGVPESDALELAVVLQIFAQHQSGAGLLRNSPLHRIPERKAVLLDGPDRKAQASRRGGDDRKQRPASASIV